jgi:hypothetical protein
MAGDEDEREAEEILSKGTVAFRHTWESSRSEGERTVEVVELDGKYELRHGGEAVGPFDSLYDALYRSDLMDELDEAGDLVALNVCEGTGNMCGDGETWIYRIGHLYLGTDSWGQDTRFFETLEDAIEHFGVFHVDPNCNVVFCTELETEEIIERLELRGSSKGPFWLVINDEDWEWTERGFRRVREDEPGADGKQPT